MKDTKNFHRSDSGEGGKQKEGVVRPKTDMVG